MSNCLKLYQYLHFVCLVSSHGFSVDPSFGGKVYPSKPIYESDEARGYVRGYPQVSAPSKNLVERFRWRFVDYAWPSEDMRQEALARGLYQPQNNLPVGIEVWQDKMFISVPRWAPGNQHYININSCIERLFYLLITNNEYNKLVRGCWPWFHK